MSKPTKHVYTFIGEVAASSTHEINNELAVIKEQSSLAAELLALGRGGRPFNPADLEHLVNRVIARVGRADQLVKRMNRFAHSMDKEEPICELSACLALMAEMFQRPAGLKRVSLQIGEAEPIEAPLGELACEELIWNGLRALLAAAEPGSTMSVSLQQRSGETCLIFSGTLAAAPDLAGFAAWEESGVRAEMNGQGFYLKFPRAVGGA